MSIVFTSSIQRQKDEAESKSSFLIAPVNSNKVQNTNRTWKHQSR